MKPKNFPERKRQRQARALTVFRLQRQSLSRAEMVELATLHQRVGVGDQRAKRTKKDRTSRAKFRAA